jgi:mono/diheme cytochrome c family protein
LGSKFEGRQGWLSGESVVPKFGSVVQWVVSICLSGAATAAQAQNLDAGKSPAQIFSDTCSACHRSPREIKQTTPGFIREHYTTSGREAAAMAAYLASVGSDPRAVKQRRPPALGAGQAPTEMLESPPQETDQTAIRPPQSIPQDAHQADLPELPGAATSPSRQPTPTAGERVRPSERPKSSQDAVSAIKPRRPSQSVEIREMPGNTEAGAARQNSPIEGFEE